MRALRCEHGQHLEAPNDEELFERLKAHVDREHPDRQLGASRSERPSRPTLTNTKKYEEAGEAEPGYDSAGTYYGEEHRWRAPARSFWASATKTTT